MIFIPLFAFASQLYLKLPYLLFAWPFDNESNRFQISINFSLFSALELINFSVTHQLLAEMKKNPVLSVCWN